MWNKLTSMMLLAVGAFASLPAIAACPAIGPETERAWFAYHDAELQQASEHLAQAEQALTCQSSILTPQTLVELYLLQALVALSQGQEEAVSERLARSVAVDPHLTPDDRMGPELRVRHAEMKEQLTERWSFVELSGSDKVWIDGRKIEAGTGRWVVSGFHLVQRSSSSGVSGELVNIQDDWSLGSTNESQELAPVSEEPASASEEPAPASEEPAPASEEPAPASEEPAPEAKKAQAEPKQISKPPVVTAASTEPDRPTWLPSRKPMVVAGASATTVGVFALIVGGNSEKMFRTRDFSPLRIGDCYQGEACYPDARDEAQRDRVRRINTLYTLGWSLTGLGVVALGTEFIVLPQLTSDGGFLGFHARW